jgi:hypothetical protein
LEESYEVVDSVFNKKPASVAEELGDMHVRCGRGNQPENDPPPSSCVR